MSQGKVPLGATSGWSVTVFVWLISTIDNEGVLLGTEVDLADNELRWGNLAIHHCANGDDVRCERVRTSDARGYLSNRLRHLQQFLPDTFDSVEKADTTPRGCSPDLQSRLRPSREGEVTGEGKTDGPLDKTFPASSVVEEHDVRTLWVDTDMTWESLEAVQKRSLRELHHHPFHVGSGRGAYCLGLLQIYLSRGRRCQKGVFRVEAD